MADGRVIIDTALNNKGLERGITRMKGELGGLTSVVKKLGTAIGIAFGVKAMVDFGKQAVELGSNVAEVQNVVDVAFGDMADKVESFAKTSIQNFGMSQLAAKKTASTYMAMARGMGVAEDAASDMAISLAGLSGDVASFFNISQELADVKLKSVFTGETETLKDLGVVMTQANLKAFALERGITKSIDSMTQAELVALRYKFVLKQLALANGDFARTSDSWANQTRILSMQWQEFMSIMGQALISVLTPVVRALNSIVSALIGMANAFNAFISGIFGGADRQIRQTAVSAGAVTDAIGGSVENQDALTDAAKRTAKAQNKVLAGFDEINQLSAGAAGSGSGAGAGGGMAAVDPLETVTTGVQDGGAQKVLDFVERLNRALEPARQALAGLFDQLDRAGGFAWDALRDFYDTFLRPLSAWVLGEGLPHFVNTLTDGLAAIDWERVNGALHDLWTALEPFAEHVGEGLLWLWDNVLVPLGTWTMNEVVPRFLENLATVIDLLNTVIEKAKPALEWLWDHVLEPFASWTGGMLLDKLDEFRLKLEFISDLLSGDFDGAVEDAKELLGLFGNRFTRTKELAVQSWEGIKEAYGAVKDWFNETVIVPLSEHFSELWDGVKLAASDAWTKIKEVFSHISDWFRDKFSAAWQAVKDVFSSGGEVFDGIKDGILSGLKAVINALINGINKVIAVPFNGLNSALRTIRGMDILGLRPFSWINTISVPRIPRLAQGAVIPPNREFLAVLGDQRSGNNIEAPEGLIRRIVREETGGGGETLAALQAILEAVRAGKVLTVDKRVLARIAAEGINDLTVAAGRPVLLY